MIDFKNYRYIGPHIAGEDNAKYDYNEEHYQSLLRDNRYRDAANYLANYELKDGEEQIKHLNYIDQLRSNGEIVEAAYSKIDNKIDLNTVEFADKVGTPGWYNNLRYKKDASGKVDLYADDEDFKRNNPYAAEVISCLENIGSSNLHKATMLSITFDPRTYGFLGINWSEKNDNDKALNSFYANGGFTDDYLREFGVDVQRDDKTGETTITFDKTNPKALDILAALPTANIVKNLPRITGYYVDDKGNTIKIDQLKDIRNEGYFSMFERDIQQGNNGYANKIDAIIKEARTQRDKIFEKRELTDYEVSSTVFDLSTDRLDQIEYMHDIGRLSDGEYDRRKKNAKDLVGWLRAQTYLDGIYSNVNNKEFTDEHFENIGQEEWFKIKNALGEFEDKDIIMEGQTINGELGIRVTLPQAQRKKRLASTEEGGFLHTDKRNIQFFIPASAIPGMLGELQKEVNNRTDLQAVQDFDNMVGYGVKKQLYNGEIIYIDDAGHIVREYNGIKNYDERPDAKQRAIDDLNQTRILEKGKYLKFQHMNEAGEINRDSFEIDAKNYAIMAGNDLIDAPLRDLDGNYLLTRNSDGTINYGSLFDPTLDSSNYQADVYRKIIKINQIYYILLNEIWRYNLR